MSRPLLQLLFWGAISGLMIAMSWSFGSTHSGPVLIYTVLGVGMWLASEGLRALALRHGWLERPFAALALRLLPTILVCATIVQSLLYVILTVAIDAGWVTMPGNGQANYSVAAFLVYVGNSAFLLVLWTALWLIRHARRRARRSELAAANAAGARQRLELDALKSRLNPHFIFNALNNLRALILEDQERARDVVTRLSNTLRYALYHSQNESVTLAEELAVVDDYLAVEAIHYEERLQVQRTLGAGVLEARLPPMLLQLLVENAIKHGIARTPGGGVLELAAWRDPANDTLCLEVRNPGRLDAAPGAAVTPEAGVGLAYLDTRLRQYWPGATFALTPIDAGRVQARLLLPQNPP